VFERDFLAEAGRPRAFAFRVTVAVAVTAVVLVMLQQNRRAFSEAPDVAARELFRGGSLALLAALAILTPPAVVGTVLDERQRETLPIVLAAPGGPRGFALAKVLSRSLAVLFWGLAALLPISFITLFGGVGGGQILDLGILAVGVVLELAAWGVLVSSFTAKLASGAVLGFVLPFARWGLFAGVSLAIADGCRDASAVPAWLAASTTPVPGAMRMAYPSDYASQVSRSMGTNQQWVWAPPRPGARPVMTSAATARPIPIVLRAPALVYLLFAGAFAAWAVEFAGRRLATESEPRGGFMARLLRGRRRVRPPPVRGNPVAWKEARLLNTAASRALYYTVLGVTAAGEIAAVIYLGVRQPSSREFVGLGLVITACHATLLGLVAAVNGAASIAYERSTGTLDLLRASPLRPAEILQGKIAGTFRGLGILALIPLLHLGLFLATGILDPITTMLGLALLCVHILFWSGVGTQCGLATFRLGKAVTSAAAIFGAALVGIPLLCILLGEVLHLRGLADALTGACPPAGAFLVLDASAQTLAPGYWRDPYSPELHTSGVLWSVACAVGGLVWFQVAPRLLARRFDLERDEG
jgi:ABC-type transport system involved in multi-copper enzyme maturation permease subunit